MLEEVYMQQPEVFHISDTSIVCKLSKSLYGLKHAPRAWFNKLQELLYKLGFFSAKSDQSLFILHTPEHTTYILVYIDDILVSGSSISIVNIIINTLKQQFPLKDLGELNYYLGTQASHHLDSSVHLGQSEYIMSLLNI